MASVDVVIPTWRGRDLLAGCLSHLAAQAFPSLSVIVVDNASADGTAELVREKFPSVQLLSLSENVGFGRAVNAGVAAGSGEIVVLLNNDVDVEPGFIAAVTAPFADPAVGMVAGMTLMPCDADVVDGFGVELDATLAAYNRLRGEPPTAQPGVLAGPSGGAAAYRRSAWEQVGGFDERLFAYGEDVDLALRMRAARWKAAEAPAARGVHLGGASVGVASPRQRELAGFARGYLLRRYGVLRTRAALRALLFEALVVGWGLIRFRTTIPLRARIRGWRAGAGERRPIPAGAIEHSIGWREAFRRLRRP
jgi:N-acetylglucosaminyl-diphospho-decaprenol L-rhamnosyltransferase